MRSLKDGTFSTVNKWRIESQRAFSIKGLKVRELILILNIAYEWDGLTFDRKLMWGLEPIDQEVVGDIPNPVASAEFASSTGEAGLEAARGKVKREFERHHNLVPR